MKIKMDNKNIPTGIGIIIIMIITIALVIFLLKYENIEDQYKIQRPKSVANLSNSQLTASDEAPLPDLTSGTSLIEKVISSDISKWKEYKNTKLGFSITYPEELNLSSMGSQGQIFGKLIQTKNNSDHTEALVYIYEPSSKDISNKPLAKTLNDYKKSYFVNGQRKIVIISQEEKYINGIRMLKQFYSAGDDKEKLEKVKGKLNQSDFDENNFEKISFAYEQNAIRYIIPNKKGGFITIKTWKSDDNYEQLLDKIVSTFHADSKL